MSLNPIRTRDQSNVLDTSGATGLNYWAMIRVSMVFFSSLREMLGYCHNIHVGHSLSHVFFYIFSFIIIRRCITNSVEKASVNKSKETY
jgi:hypothetical protein